MRPDEREALRKRFQFRCAYCGVAEHDVGAELTTDHFRPRSRDGLHEPDNWVYCCHPCNQFKGDYWQPDSIQRILHPIRDDIATHIVERLDGVLVALSGTGEFHIERLHLNRLQLIAYRYERRQLEATRMRFHELVDRLDQLEVEVGDLAERLSKLERNDPAV